MVESLFVVVVLGETSMDIGSIFGGGGWDCEGSDMSEFDTVELR